MPDDRALHRARVFERFWEALAAGRPVAPPDELEPEVVEVARRLRSLGRPATTDAVTDATFESRLWEDLMQAHALDAGTPFDASIPLRPTVLPHANGRSTASPPARSHPLSLPGTARGRRSVVRRGHLERRGTLTRLAVAAIVLLALGVGLVARDPDLRRPDRDVIPAAVFQDAAPSPSAAPPESLVEVVIPDGVIAAGEPTDFVLSLYTLPSGTTTRPANTASNGCCPGLNVLHVLDGSATVRGDGPMRLLPSGGGLEPSPVTAGTDVVIEPGDTLLLEEDVATDWTVADGGSPSLLWGLVFGGMILAPPFGPSGWVAEDMQMKGPVPFPVDPYAIRLWPTTLAPGATLEPADGAVQLVVSYPSEDARIGDQGGYAYTNLGDEPIDLYVMTLSTSDPGTASPIAVAPSSTPTP